MGASLNRLLSDTIQGVEGTKHSAIELFLSVATLMKQLHHIEDLLLDRSKKPFDYCAGISAGLEFVQAGCRASDAEALKRVHWGRPRSLL